MTRNLSVYLEAIRFFAAIGVLLNHAENFIMPALPYQISGHGTECVAIFFLLSGFVIRFVNVEKSENSWQAYAIARLSRIVPVAFLALAFTIVLDQLGLLLAPNSYDNLGWGLDATWNVGELLRSMTFLNEIWFIHTVFGTNGPYWSLGYEVPYYIFFGLLLFTSGKARILAIILWALLYGPKIIAYLPLWLLGVVAYDLIRNRPKFRAERRVGAVLIAISVVGYYILKFKAGTGFHSIYLPTSLGNMLAGAAHYLTIGLLCAINFLGVDMLLGKKPLVSDRMTKVIRWLAGGTFTLYLFHLPIMLFIAAQWPGVKASATNGLLALGMILLSTYVIAELAERRKRPARKFFESLLMMRWRRVADV